MKKSGIIGLLIFIISFSANSQDVYIYGRNGAKELFSRIDSIVQIKFKDGVSDSSKIAIVRSINKDVDYSGISKEQSIRILIDKNSLPDYEKLNNNRSLVYANQSLQYTSVRLK